MRNVDVDRELRDDAGHIDRTARTDWVRVDRAQLAYGNSAAAAERILPFLSPERQVASGWRGGLLSMVY